MSKYIKQTQLFKEYKLVFKLAIKASNDGEALMFMLVDCFTALGQIMRKLDHFLVLNRKWGTK